MFLGSFDFNFNFFAISLNFVKNILIQPPREPRAQNLGEVRQGTSKFKFYMDPISFILAQFDSILSCLIVFWGVQGSGHNPKYSEMKRSYFKL